MADDQIQLNAIITDQGFDAAVDVAGSSMSLAVTHIAVGDGSYPIVDADGAALSTASARTSLLSERARVAIGQSKKVDGQNGFMTAARFLPGGAEYAVREVGLFADDVLVAVWSDPSKALQYKVPQSDMVIFMGIVLDRLPFGAITVLSDGSLNLLMDDEMAVQAAATIFLQNQQLIDLQRIRALEGKGA